MFERIVYRRPGSKRRRTIWARVLSEDGRFLRLRELDDEGNDKSFTRKDGTIVDRQHLLDKTLIVSRERAQENKKYGTMEVV